MNLHEISEKIYLKILFILKIFFFNTYDINRQFYDQKTEKFHFYTKSNNKP